MVGTLLLLRVGLVDTHLLLGVGEVVVTPIVWRSGGHTPIVWRSGGHTGLGIRSFQKNVPFFPIFCVLL